MEFSTILTIDLVLLTILLLSVLWIYFAVIGREGVLRKPFNTIGIGVVLMGLSHVIELVSSYLYGHHDTYLIAFSHHLLATLGFLIIAIGFRQLIQPK